jgi:hypothetical protein
MSLDTNWDGSFGKLKVFGQQHQRFFSVNPFFCSIFCSYIIDFFVQVKHLVHTRVQESLFKMDDIFQFVSSKARGMSAEVKTLGHQSPPEFFIHPFLLCG